VAVSPALTRACAGSSPVNPTIFHGRVTQRQTFPAFNRLIMRVRLPPRPPPFHAKVVTMPTDITLYGALVWLVVAFLIGVGYGVGRWLVSKLLK
jgi:hypothetical protein